MGEKQNQRAIDRLLKGGVELNIHAEMPNEVLLSAINECGKRLVSGSGGDTDDRQYALDEARRILDGDEAEQRSAEIVLRSQDIQERQRARASQEAVDYRTAIGTASTEQKNDNRVRVGSSSVFTIASGWLAINAGDLADSMSEYLSQRYIATFALIGVVAGLYATAFSGIRAVQTRQRLSRCSAESAQANALRKAVTLGSNDELEDGRFTRDHYRTALVGSTQRTSFLVLRDTAPLVSVADAALNRYVARCVVGEETSDLRYLYFVNS